MMTTAEILTEIYQLPVNQQNDLRKKILDDSELNGQTKSQITQDEFDRVLLSDGFLANLPVESVEEEDFIPVEFTGKPISETIIEERR